MSEKESSSIDILLSRILSGKANSNDVNNFNKWIKISANEKYFLEYKEIWHTLYNNNGIDDERTNRALNSYINYIDTKRKRNRVRKTLYYSVSSAALVSVIAGLYLLTQSAILKDGYNAIAFSKLKYNSDTIRFELSSGRSINPLNKESKASLLADLNGDYENLNISKRELNYYINSKKIKQSDSLKFNSIEIPPGERFVVVLSDGTKVYLNSGSSLRYPVSFSGTVRNVCLEGRAYFDVSKSNTPFIVSTEDLKIEVLGTSFDVESKRNSNKSSVILIEGSVIVHDGGKSVVIKPDEMYQYNKEVQEGVIKCVDSKSITQCKDGILVLKDISFDDMIMSLSNWYGVEIINNSSISNQERFNGKFDREDIVAAIKTVAMSAKVRYRIVQGRLIIVDYK